MAPPFLSGDDDDWKKISKEIIMVTTALKLCQEGKVTSPPPDEQLRLFQHISVLVTTDEFQEDSTTSTEKPKKSDASIVNAVTGRVEADRIVSVVFTHNAIPIGETSTGGTFKQITSQDNGNVLLDGWETMQDKVSFDKHLQDVVDILQHLLRGDRGTTDVGAALLFVHRRAFPKLASRVRKAVHLWGGAPFSLISQYYKDSKSPIAVTSASFLLRDIGGGMHGDLETLTLPCNSSYRSSDGSRQYFVNSENVVRWVDFIHSTYSKIEEIVERNMIYGGRVTVRPLSVRDAIALVEAISVLNRLLHAKALMTTIFSMNGLKKYIVEKFESARSKAVWSNVTKTGGAELSTLEVTDDAAESEDREDEDEDEDAIGDAELLDARDEEDASDISELQLGADIHMLWYCRTITAWSEAVSAIGRHTARLPDAMDLQVFQVDTFPSPETVCKSNVNDFTRRYLATLTDDNKQTQSAKAFVADRLGKSFRKKANHPVVHAEATAMGLICISVFGGESFGDFTKEWVDKALPTSGKIPIAVSKKCCKCCAILVELLNERGKGEFVLPGTHATFFPWCPPRGVPLDILKEMRDRLYDIFDFQARNFIPSPLSTRSSPAMSEASLPVDEMLPKPRSE